MGSADVPGRADAPGPAHARGPADAPGPAHARGTADAPGPAHARGPADALGPADILGSVDLADCAHLLVLLMLETWQIVPRIMGILIHFIHYGNWVSRCKSVPGIWHRFVETCTVLFGWQSRDVNSSSKALRGSISV